jgi:hypothetical protein
MGSQVGEGADDAQYRAEEADEGGVVAEGAQECEPPFVLQPRTLHLRVYDLRHRVGPLAGVLHGGAHHVCFHAVPSLHRLTGPGQVAGEETARDQVGIGDAARQEESGAL